MRHWIKRWLDWLMNEFVTPRRLASQSQAIYYRFEKAGLLIDQQPVVASADAVIVEAVMRLPPRSRNKNDFRLKLTDGSLIPAETIRPEEAEKRHRVIFRLSVPPETITAELTWNHKAIGSITIDVLSVEAFLKSLRLDMPTAFVTFEQQSIACQTFVANQMEAVSVSGVIRNPLGLITLRDVGISVIFENRSTGDRVEHVAPLTTTQLAGREAIITAMPPKFPKKSGEWLIRWQCGPKTLAETRLLAITPKEMAENIRICDSQLVLQAPSGRITLDRNLPAEGVHRVGPCFFLSSRLSGMAGLVSAEVRLRVPGAEKPIPVFSADVLLSDGPTPFTPGLLDVAELQGATAFEMRIRNKTVAMLPLKAIPTARLTAEGGYLPTPDFTWNDAAENELTERLERLFKSE